MSIYNPPVSKEKIFTFFCIFTFAVLCLALIPWLNIQWEQAVNTDIAYLTLSAERLLDGARMSEAYYDTNPPLSIIAQIPAAVLARYTDIPIYYAVNIYPLSLLFFSMLAISSLLGYFKEITIEQRILLLAAFLLTNTIYTKYDFGQKDQLLGMAVFPMVLVQFLITRKNNFPVFLKHITLAAGAFFILIKPHYGIIPASIFIHRAITQRRWRVIFDADFIWLSAMAAGYLAIIILFFGDFLTVILPDVVKYYASLISANIIYTGTFLIFKAGIIFLIAQQFFNKAPQLISALSLIAALCFIPFIIQGKGWNYHALPANMFFHSSIAILMNFSIFAGLKKLQKTSYAAKIISFVLPMALLFSFLANDYITPKKNYITHQDYKNTNFAKRIEACNDKHANHCSFLILDFLINISKELSVYTNTPHATRFSHLWFLPAFLLSEKTPQNNKPSKLSREELEKGIEKYMKLMAQDFNNYDPKLVFVPHFLNCQNPPQPMNMRNYTLENAPELFEPIWAQYKLEESVIIDRLEYMHSKLPDETLMRYDIYVKNNN